MTIEEIIERLRDPRYFEQNGLIADAADAMTKMNAVMSEFIIVMNDSHGVAGFHLNGDIANWDEFLNLNDALAELTDRDK